MLRDGISFDDEIALVVEVVTMLDPEQILGQRRRRDREGGIAVEVLDCKHERSPLNMRELPISLLELAVERATKPDLNFMPQIMDRILRAARGAAIGLDIGLVVRLRG
jgi:hypothetical protein